MHDDDPVEVPKDVPKESSDHSGVSRRDFLKISSISVAVPLVAGPRVVRAAGQEIPVHGPGKVPMEFSINGKSYKADLEPRVTLLDALRDQFELTGAKRVCDRAECGACTVLMDNKTVYACSLLAIEAQHKTITTVESLMEEENCTPCSRPSSTMTPRSAVSALRDSSSLAKRFSMRIRTRRQKKFAAASAGIFAAAALIPGIRQAIAQVAQKGA